MISEPAKCVGDAGVVVVMWTVAEHELICWLIWAILFSAPQDLEGARCETRNEGASTRLVDADKRPLASRSGHTLQGNVKLDERIRGIRRELWQEGRVSPSMLFDQVPA